MNAYLVGLVLSMSVSLGCVIALYMYYPGLKTLVPFFLIMVSGLIGLFFATKVKAKKIKGLLLVINYLFATQLIFLYFSNGSFVFLNER